ncbi:MAG: hypothetical protein JOZ37_12470, partial [Actinobacteria bacterium]|nr:hypothetical protein [Actinomycetota bacterium]
MNRRLTAALLVVVLAGCGRSEHRALRASLSTTSSVPSAAKVTTSTVPATTLPPSPASTAAAPRPAMTVAPRPAPRPVTTTTQAPFDEGRLPFVKIFAPHADDTVHRSDQFNGSVVLPDGDKLYLLVYTPPAGGAPGQYYDAAAPVVMSANRESWTSNASGISGDAGVVDTLYAFILPPNEAAAYEASDKSNMHSLPPGVQAKDQVDFV